jgi:TIR domain
MFVGFWSYVRDDDHADNGRITRLAERVRDEYAMLTGGPLEVFVDREAIEWGHEWQQRIDGALADTAFFVPVITPRYFASEACRAELLSFSGHAASLGVSELLMPLYYVEIPD